MVRLTFALALPLLLGQPPASWKSFTSKEGGFSVSLPAIPREKRQTVKGPKGAREVTIFVLEAKGDGSFVVSFSEFSPSEVKAGSEEKRLSHARDGAVESTKGKLLHERKITLEGHAGRELWIEKERQGIVQLRLYAVRNRLYQTLAVGPKEFIESKETGWFLDSFKLIK